jgi:hypothetical protein
VTTFHLWFSSNSLNDDSIRLHLFKHALNGGISKWYIELKRGKYSNFCELAMVFLNHFQLLVRYDAWTKLMANFEHDNATHIFDHIQEWRRWKILIKATVPPEFLLEWFPKSLLPYILKDVTTSGVFLEE